MTCPRISALDMFRESRLEAAIFDMDGVLSDTEEFHLEAWHLLVRRHTGGDASEELVRSTFGQTNDLIIPRLWEARSETLEKKIDDLSREKESLYRQAARGRLKPVPGLERFLDWLAARRIPIAVGTSGPPENVHFLLSEFGWERHFKVVADRSRFAAGKPAPDCFLKAAELLGKRPERVIVFEDSIHGLLSARGGGFPVCAVATTFPEAALRSKARWVLRDFQDIAC